VTVKRKRAHKYDKGDLVGIILRRVRKRDGEGFSYVVTAETIHHPKPEESFFGKNKEFVVLERQIVVKLSH